MAEFDRFFGPASMPDVEYEKRGWLPQCYHGHNQTMTDMIVLQFRDGIARDALLASLLPEAEFEPEGAGDGFEIHEDVFRLEHGFTRTCFGRSYFDRAVHEITESALSALRSMVLLKLGHMLGVRRGHLIVGKCSCVLYDDVCTKVHSGRVEFNMRVF